MSFFRGIDRCLGDKYQTALAKFKPMAVLGCPANSSDDTLQIHPVEGEQQLAKKKNSDSAGRLVNIICRKLQPFRRKVNDKRIP